MGRVNYDNHVNDFSLDFSTIGAILKLHLKFHTKHEIVAGLGLRYDLLRFIVRSKADSTEACS